MSLSPQQQQQIAEGAAGAAIAAGTSPLWMSVDHILQTATLTLGVIAGGFAVYFHVRKFFRERPDRETK